MIGNAMTTSGISQTKKKERLPIGNRGEEEGYRRGRRRGVSWLEDPQVPQSRRVNRKAGIDSRHRRSRRRIWKSWRPPMIGTRHEALSKKGSWRCNPLADYSLLKMTLLFHHDFIAIYIYTILYLFETVGLEQWIIANFLIIWGRRDVEVVH